MNLEEEVICGFKVSKTRKVLWQIELDMLKEVYRICDKYGLICFGSGGTILGAVRHNGFIPWDDDIDLGMFRDDYNKFLEVAPKELPQQYFMQYFTTEKKYTYGHIKIRNNNTACLLGSSFTDLELGKNCGVFIDIFPYDYVPDELRERKRFERKILAKKKWAERDRFLHSYKLNNLRNIVKYFIIKTYFLFHDAQKLVEQIDVLAQKYNSKKTNTVEIVEFMPGNEKVTFPIDIFDDFILINFENTEIKIPRGYDKLLKIHYGDYMKLPKNKDGSGSYHGICFYDLKQSFIIYRNMDYAAYEKLFKEFQL